MDESEREFLGIAAFWLGVACVLILVTRNKQLKEYLPTLGMVGFGAGLLARYG